MHRDAVQQKNDYSCQHNHALHLYKKKQKGKIRVTWAYRKLQGTLFMVGAYSIIAELEMQFRPVLRRAHCDAPNTITVLVYCSMFELSSCTCKVSPTMHTSVLWTSADRCALYGGVGHCAELGMELRQSVQLMVAEVHSGWRPGHVRVPWYMVQCAARYDVNFTVRSCDHTCEQVCQICANCAAALLQQTACRRWPAGA